MAMVDDQVLLNTQDTGQESQWTVSNHNGVGLNDSTSQTPIYREGSACGDGQLQASTAGTYTDNLSVTAINNGIRADKLYVIWLWMTSNVTIDATTDIMVGIADATNFGGDSALWDMKPLFQAVDRGGWQPCAIYPTQPDQISGIFANLNKAAIRSQRVDIDNSSGSEVRLFGIEQSFLISYIGGHSQTVTLDNLVTHSRDKTNHRDSGMINSNGDAYRSQVVIRLGHATATTTTTFNESAKVLHFDNFNTDHEIGFDFIGDLGADANNFTLTGCFLFWNNGASAAFVGVANLDVWSVTGNTFLRSGSIELPANATGFVTNTNVMDACGEIDIGDAVFESNTVKNAASGAIYVGTGTRRSVDNNYINNTDAIHFDTAQTITLDGDQFSGNTSDIHFSGTGTLTINLTNGANPVSSRVSGGGTVVINQPSVTILINVKNESGTNLQNARVLIETAATIASGEIFEAAVTSITQTAGTATVTMSAVHGLVTGDTVAIRGAQPDDYNKVAVITVTSTTAFTYTISAAVSSPATDTPLVSYVALHALTDVSGNASLVKPWTAAQSLKGWARLKNTSTPFYKDADFAFSVNTTSGNTINKVLLNDE